MFVSISIHAEGRLLLDTSFDLTDKEGVLVAKMKILLSLISGSIHMSSRHLRLVS